MFDPGQSVYIISPFYFKISFRGKIFKGCILKEEHPHYFVNAPEFSIGWYNFYELIEVD
jgi:hypothetical protein